MGDVQSTQQESRQDAAAEEGSRDVDHPQTEQNTQHENGEQTSADISRKREEVKMNGCCEDENAAQGLPLIPTKEATPETQGNKEESEGEVNANDGVHLEITEIDVKQNDINTFGRIFSNFGLKVTINRGLGEKARDDDDDDDDEKTSTEETQQTKTEKTEDKAEGNIEQESSDPILTGVTSEDVLGNADVTAETSEEPELKADGVTDTQEPEPQSMNSTGPIDVEIDSPIRKFFTAGIFVGLWKQKEDETTEQELEEVGGDKVIDTTGQTVQDRHEEEVTAAGVVGKPEEKGNELRGETAGKSPEGDILSSQDRDRSQMSPLLRFLSGSSLKRVSMKQRNIKSSEARLCDSGEHPSELLPSDPADDRGNASSPTSEEAAKEEEEGAWASFKRFMSPKPRMKKSHHSAEETQQAASVGGPKAEQMADHSSEEGKKRKNSSVSWEAVLCGSGRRRSRKTSDSEDEMPPIDLKYHKQDGGPKSGEESGAENEKDTSSSSKQDGTLQEDDGGSTWKSLKRIVTPKRKSRDEDEGMKIKFQSDSEDAEEKSSFSIKNLLPGRKKQRSEESQGPASSDEAGKGVASDDEDSETPCVVPLSEFEGDEEKKESLEEEKYSELQQDQVEETYLCFPQDFDEALEKQEDSNKELDEASESARKHQQLSDIQEEGVVTEPRATLALVSKEVESRDDTAAEDPMEVASEAFTAPEPAADVTLQDETEMFTAVSQFSTESAKTSGNATPVPAESNIIDSDTVLHQLAQTFSTSPEAAAPRPEQTFQAFVEKDPTVIELHRRPGAIPTETGLDVEDLEAISTLVSASLREGVSKVTDFQSEGVVSVEEFDSTEMTLDDVHVISVTQESANEDEKNAPVSPVEQVKTKSVMSARQEPDLASTIGATTKNGDLEQEVPTLTDNGDLNKHSISDHPKGEDEEQSSAEEERVQDHAKELAEAVASGGGVDQGEHKVRAASAERLPLTEENVTLNDEHVQEPEGIEGPVEGHVLSLEPKDISHNISMCWGKETVGDKPEVETHLLTQVFLEQLDASKSIEEPEDLPAEQASSSKLQEGNMSSHGPQMASENLAKAEAHKGEADKTRLLTETLEPVETEALQTHKETSSNGEVNILPFETEVITENEEAQDILETAREPDVSQPYEASAEMSTEVKDSDNIIQLQELNNSTVLTEDTLEPVEASKTTEKPDNILKEELDLDEIKKETINTEDPSGSPAEPEAMKAFALASEEDQVLPSETMILLKDEQEIHTTHITEDAAELMDDAPNAKEPELSLESEESRGQSLEREVTSDSISEEKTVTAEPRSETTVVDETVIEPVDDSKTIQILEELQPVKTLVGEESSTSQPEATSENNLTAEGDTEGGTMLHTDFSHESEDVVKVLQEPEELQMQLEGVSQTLVKEKTTPDEPEDVKSITETLFEKVDFKTSTFVSEEFGIPSLDLEGTSENFLKADLVTEEHKMQTNLATKDTPEPLDDPQNVEEEELSLQPSCDETKNIHEAEEISEKTPKAETVPDKTNEEMILDSEETKAVEELEALMTVHPTPAESEHLSLGKEATCDHVSGEERVLEEPKEVGVLSDTDLQSEDLSEEAKVLQALQQSLESEETKQEISDNVTEAERVSDDHRDETTVAGDIISEPEDESKTTDVVEELQPVQRSSLVSEEHSIPHLEAEEPPENIHGAESDADEHKVEMVVATEDTSAPKAPEAPELFQTVQVCSLEIGDNSVSSAEAEITSEIILKGETLPDEPRDETTIAGETVKEPVAGSKTDEVVEELQPVETFPFVSEDSSTPTLKAEDTFEDISKEQLDTAKNIVETVLIRVEPPQPKTAEEPELSLQLTVQSSSIEPEDNSIPSAEPERTSEIICKEETLPDESKEEPKLHSEITLEPEDPSENVGEAEVSRTVHIQSLESEETKQETSDNISEEERVIGEPGDEKTVAGDIISEPEDESKTTEVVEELQTVQRSSLVSEEHSIPHLEAEEPPEHIHGAESDADEHKVEMVVATEDTSAPKTPETPELFQTARPKTAGEPELSLQLTVQSSSLESEDNSIPSAEPERTSETICKEETLPDESRIETIGEAICEPLDESKTAELEEQQTVQPFTLVEYKCNIPPLEAEEPFDSISKAESVPDETSEETTLDPEDTETAEGPEALPAVHPTAESEHPSLAKETMCDNFSGEEKVPDEPKEEAIIETLDACKPIQELGLIQEGVVPLLDTEELGGKANNVVESETDTVLVSEVNPTVVDVHKPEVLSVEASDETHETGEEDLRVETADHKIKGVEPEEDLPVEEFKTGHVHRAEEHLDKSESEGETSEQKPETVPKDDQMNQESPIPEEEYPAAAQVDKRQPKVVSEAVPHIPHMGQASEASMDTTQTGKVAEEEDGAATPTVRDGVTKEVEGGKAEDEDTVAVGEADVDIEAEGTTLGSLPEVEAVGGKAATEVCCSVVHTRCLSAATMPEKEQILAEDEVMAKGEKPQVESEEQQCTNVDAKERRMVDGQANTGEVEVEGLTRGLEEPKHLEALGGPGCPESVHEDALDVHGNNKDKGEEKESAGSPVDQEGLEDGEENMDIQKATAGSVCEVEEALESERGDKDVEQAGLEKASKNEEENEETSRADEARGSGGDGKDSDVALEHPGNTSVTTVSLTG